MTVTEIPHSPYTCYGSPNHCYWHDIDEPGGDIYRACYECKHVYQSAGDLLTAWQAVTGETLADADDVPSCAFCAHDW